MQNYANYIFISGHQPSCNLFELKKVMKRQTSDMNNKKDHHLLAQDPQEFSAGHSRLCCILLTSCLEQSLRILDFEAKKAFLAKSLQKQTKDGLQLLPPLHPLDHNPRWNQETMFHPYVLPVFSCSSYVWPSLSCMFFLMENKSKWNLLNLQRW